MEVAVDQWRPVVETEAEVVDEVGLVGRRSQHLRPTATGSVGVDMLLSNGSAAHVTSQKKVVNGGGDGSSENSVYLDKNGGALEDLDIPKILNDAAKFDDHQKPKNQTFVESLASREGAGEGGASDSQLIEEEIEEEVVELEFEKAIPKLETHSMHCPNCDAHITRVVLRRKLIKKVPRVTEQPHKPVDLLGCLSCFSLFVPSGNGSCNPFSIFGNGSSTSEVPPSPAGGNEGTKVVFREQGNCLSMFRIFGKGGNDSSTEEPPQTPPRNVNRPSPSSDQLPPKYVTGNPPIEKGAILEQDDGETNKPNGYRGLITSRNPSKLPEDGSHFGVPQPQEDDTKIDVLPETDIENAVLDNARFRGRPLLGYEPVPTTEQENQPEREQQGSIYFEILKSIVYGGLMEVIASLSIIASAAAADATTLNIISLALANLIGGILIIGHNLWELRDDCYKGNSTQQTNQEATIKYKELLGQIDHFPLHAVLVILSFLVFGLIPPVAYGFGFHETNDNDFTIVAVAVASLVCVGLLAIFKAYIDRCSGFFGYVKTVVYYVTTAVTASGVSYVAGNLVTRLLYELGLFDTPSSGVAMSVLPNDYLRNPSLTFY